MSVHPSLFGDQAPVVPIRDALERCYTTDPLAKACLESVARYVPDPKVIIEPSVGGGSFVRAIRLRWPDCEVWGCDIDIDAAGLALCDEVVVDDWSHASKAFANRARAKGVRIDAIIGNPPFSLAIEHIQASWSAFDRMRCMSLILPLAYLGVGEWQQAIWASDVRLAQVQPIAGRPWPQRMRETAVYTWAAGHFGSRLILPALEWRAGR